MSSFVSQRQPVPPLLGLPEEKVVENDTMTDFYTCLFGELRVFVWGVYDGWYVQTAENIIDRDLVAQFTLAKSEIDVVAQGCPITLKAVILDLAGGASE